MARKPAASLDDHPPHQSTSLLLGLPALFLFVFASVVAGRYFQNPILRLTFFGAMALIALSIPLLRRAALTTIMVAGLVGATVWAWQNRQKILETASTVRETAARRFVDLEHAIAGASRTWAGQGSIAARLHSAGPYQRYLDKVDPRSPEVNRIASRLAADCDDADHLCETVRLLEYVTSEIDYRNDPRGSTDYVKSPHETLESGAGDCEDKTILLVSLLESLGNETFMAFSESHTFPLVCYDTSIDAQLTRKERALGPRAFRRYVMSLAPHHDVEALRRAARRVVMTRIGGRYCYPLEPTARGSWIGYDHHEPLRAVFDSVQGTPVAVGR